jgi:molybdate transport system substrate-binding protein
LGFTALLMSNVASAAEVRVMISAGFFDVYSELGPAFERATGHQLVTTRGPSTGDSPEAIPKRLARGERVDVVILEGGSADELGKKGFVRTDSKVVLALVQTGLVVRAGAPKPAAKSIAYSDSGSGRFIVETMLPKLGIADQVMPKTRKVRGPPSGEPVAAVVARGIGDWVTGCERTHSRVRDNVCWPDTGGAGSEQHLCSRRHHEGKSA